MPDLWSVAITEADQKWLEDSVSTHLANALGAVHSPDTDGGLTPLPLYSGELEWLVSRVGLECDWNPGLIFALNTAVPAPLSVRMNREWSDRNEENRKENAARQQSDPMCEGCGHPQHTDDQCETASCGCGDILDAEPIE